MIDNMFNELQENLKNLKNLKNILILTHSSPDGDAVGSCVALKMFFKKLNINADCILDEAIPSQYSFLGEHFQIKKEIEQNYDLIVFADCAGQSRCQVKYPKNIKTCVIDHHISNTRDFDINIIDASAAATGEIIYFLYKFFNIPLSDTAAAALYTAIYTDTGSFSFSNTTKKTHEIIADLWDYNFDKAYIAQKTYLEKSLIYSRLYAYLMENLTVINQNAVVIGYIDNKTYVNNNASSDDTEGLSAALRNIRGVECAVTLIEKEKGTIKGSVRSGQKYDANELAKLFGGGGHIRAAGFKTNLSFSEIKDMIETWVNISG